VEGFMNQTSLYVSHCGVGLFHNVFPPVNSIGIYPNPTHSNPRETKRNFLLECIPSLLVSSPLAYNIRETIRAILSYLTTFSRGNTSPLSFTAPADNYTNNYYIYINRITKRITNFLSLFALGVYN